MMMQVIYAYNDTSSSKMTKVLHADQENSIKIASFVMCSGLPKRLNRGIGDMYGG